MGKRINKIKQTEWIQEYVTNGGYKRRAAEKVKVSYSTVKLWLQNAEFKEQVEEAEECWFEELRSAMMARAIEKSDNLAMFFMKARDPERYDDNVRKRRFLDEIVDEISRLPRIQAKVIERSENAGNTNGFTIDTMVGSGSDKRLS